MKPRIALLSGLALALAVGAWALLSPPAPESAPPAPARAGNPPAAELAPARASRTESEPASRPRAVPSPPVFRPVALPPSPSRDFLRARQYKALYERLKNSPEGATPEGWYVLHQILRRCAAVTDGGPRRNVFRPERRDSFVASIPASDPDREKRIAAFDDVVLNPCAGLESVSVTQAELDKLLADSAAGGDPRARALAIEQELLRDRRSHGRSVTLTDAQVESLRAVAASRDPAAILTVGQVLSSSWSDFSLRIGPDGPPVDQRALHNAWQVVACDLGYPCGEGNSRVLAACAFQGHCDATSLPDYLYYYAGSPHESNLVNQYRSILRNAVDTGDWSALQVVRGPTPPGRRHFFSGGYRR